MGENIFKILKTKNNIILNTTSEDNYNLRVLSETSIIKPYNNYIRGKAKLLKSSNPIDTSTTVDYNYSFNFFNLGNEDFVKKYPQDFFVIKPEIGIIVQYEFLPFIEFHRYVKRTSQFEITDKELNKSFIIKMTHKPFWQMNNILEIDRYTNTELYLRLQRYLYPLKDSNKPYTECFEKIYLSNQDFEYDKELHNTIREEIENQYFSQLQIIQNKSTQKEMLKRIDIQYRSNGNQLIKYLIENVFEILNLNLNDLETNIILPILWKQYMVTRYQKNLTNLQVQKIIDDYMELLYLNKMDESLIDFINGRGYFNFQIFHDNLRQGNDFFERQFDPYFYKIIYQIDTFNHNTILNNLYSEVERTQRLYNLTIQVEQFLKGRINFTMLTSLLNEPNACGIKPQITNLYYIPVGVNKNLDQEIEFKYSLYHEKMSILDKLYKNEEKVYYKSLILDNLETDIIANNNIYYYTIDLNETTTHIKFRNGTKLYIGNQQTEVQIIISDNNLYYTDNLQIGYLDETNLFKLYIRKDFIDTFFVSLKYTQYIRYDIDYDRSIINEIYTEYEFINSTEDVLKFTLRIQKNYKIRKGSLKIHITPEITGQSDIILYDNHHNELVYAYPEPNTYITFIKNQYEKFGKMIVKYDVNTNETNNLEYIYQKLGTHINTIEDYLEELLQVTETTTSEIFDKLRDYLINNTMEYINADLQMQDSPVQDKEWVSKIIDDNCLHNVSNIQGYIDYKTNLISINKNLIEFINRNDINEEIDEDAIDIPELTYHDIKSTEYEFYDPKYEVHYILNCLIRPFDTTNLYLKLNEKQTNYLLNKYTYYDINNMSLQDLEQLHTITYYRMVLGHTYITDTMYDNNLYIDKNTTYPIIFSKLQTEVFENNDYDINISRFNIDFESFMNVIKITKLTEIENFANNMVNEQFDKKRILLSTQNSNIIIKLLDQLNSEIKESQFYQQNNYIINEKRDLRVNKLYNFRNYDYTNGIDSLLKDTNFIEYFIQFQINSYYKLPYFENKTRILNNISKEINTIQILKLEKLEFYIKQQTQSFYFAW